MTGNAVPSRPPELPPTDLQALFDWQRAWRWRAAQTTAAQRQMILRRLYDAIRAHRVPIAQALAADLDGRIRGRALKLFALRDLRAGR